MRFISKSIFFCFLLLSGSSLFAQKGLTTFGIQIKPIFPFNFLNTGPLLNDTANVHFETELTSGFSGGMIIRHSFSDLISLETGINYIKRKYTLKITDNDTAFNGESSFRIIGYEIPVTAMIFARVGEKLYASGSLGPACDMFASNIQTYDYYYNHVSSYRQIFQFAINGNLGLEYRTENSGTIYFGVSYHRPFSYIYYDRVRYQYHGKDVVIGNELVGNYLTVDFRYYFHEDKKKKK